ncbi:PAS domain S-box protein [bacterium]|nr:PAS domain S-box protein [bacterium]
MTQLDHSPALRKIYEKLTRTTRWLVIIFVASTMWFLPYSRQPLLILLAVAVVFNVLQYIPSFADSRLFGRKWFAIFANFLLIAALIVFTGELRSPYLPLLFLVVMSAAYWYELAGLISVLLAIGSFLGVLTIVGDSYSIATLGVFVTASIFGLYLAQLSSLDESDRDKLLDIDARLAQERAKLITLVNSLGEAIFAVDQAGNIILYNSAALELLDTHYDIASKPFSEAVHLVNQKGEEVFPAAQVLETGRVAVSDNLTLKTATYSPNVYVNITPISEQGKRTGAMVMIRDISRQKNFESQKDEFVSIISHELRTPVAIVEANVSTALLPNFVQLPDKAKKVLTDAQKNLTHLSGLLRDLSDLARSERAVIETEIMPFSSAELIRDIVANFRDQAQQAGHTISISTKTIDEQITSSRQRIEEVLVNYVTNAIKYSGDGAEIVVGASVSKNIKGGVCLWVKDNGLGMTKKDLGEIFKKFYRAQNKTTQSAKGTGMGLYIAKKQAESIGGMVWADSSRGKGSTFYLEVPVELPRAQKISKVS